jgi:hypothetical protein
MRREGSPERIAHEMGVPDDESMVHLVVAIEREREPVCGWVELENGERDRFDGMLELLAAIDARRGAGRESRGRTKERRDGPYA